MTFWLGGGEMWGEKGGGRDKDTVTTTWTGKLVRGRPR